MVTQNGQKQLIEEVINKGNCVNCGACVGLCPYFNYFDGQVVVMDRCTAETGRCLQVCPKADFEATSLEVENKTLIKNQAIGPHQTVLAARATEDKIIKLAQNGGVTSALTIFALENALINAAILTKPGGGSSPSGHIVKSKAEVIQAAGSQYSASASLSALNTAIKSGETSLGIVGVPCQIQALTKMGKIKPDGEKTNNQITYKIGLFCTWALDYRKLCQYLGKKGVNETIIKYDIPPPPSETFHIQAKNREIDLPLSEIRAFIQKGCMLCQDMTSEWADISIGAFEGRSGWNTVVVRTENGKNLLDMAIKEGIIETVSFPDDQLEYLKTAALNKWERGKLALKE